MEVNLIIIGREILEENVFDFRRFSILLSDKDYEIAKIIFCDNADELDEIIARFEEPCLFTFCGNSKKIKEKFNSEQSEISEYMIVGNHFLVSMDTFEESTVRNVIIPLLNSKCKSNYNTVVFKTFGKSEAELKEMLGKLLKSRNKISFSFPPNEVGRDVRIKYSRSTPSSSISELISNVRDVLGTCIYALKDITLAKQVARKLMNSGKKLCLAESFTGGGLASALVTSPGISSSLIESIVCYSNSSKLRRLGVQESVIEELGAVSADIAFEMANGLLSDPLCDIAVATTGNAGPTAERDGRVGLYYVAIGDRTAIHVFEQFYEVDNIDAKSVDEIRREITDAGIRTALYELGKYLNENSQENPNG